MAAAYAALLSLTNVIHTLQTHPNPPITLPNDQVQSLLQKAAFLQEFLELHSHEDAYPKANLEGLITDAAHAAEDAIESYIVDQIRGSTSEVGGRCNSFYQDLQKTIDDMDFTQKQAMQIKEKMEDGKAQQHIVSSMPNAPPVPPSLGQRNIMVGFDNLLTDILDKLTGQENKRTIIPIIGMGGSGKTTLALTAYEHALVVHRFDIRIWITVSQKFIARDILLEILCLKNQESKEGFSHMNEVEIGEKIYKSFSGMRYLIVLDDMWSTEAWDEIKCYFPNNNNGSRMIITTRISSVAIQLSGSSGVPMNLLSDEESWNLFCKHVFGEKDACPLDWEEIGKMIVRNCKGLPLSIVVVGGLLAKSKRTKQYWEYVARNLNSIINLEDDEHCLKILHMSYKQLPIHLKPCFLYLKVFPEDAKIRVSKLVKQLAAEGFLKPISRKSIEVVAKEYIKDLVDRNLILVDALGCTGNIKYCKIHDLLRDVCLREAQKERFLYAMGEHNCGMNGARRIVFRRRTLISTEKHPSQDLGVNEEYPSQDLGGFLYAPLACSLICRHECALTHLELKLLRMRILSVDDDVPEKWVKILKFGKVYDLRYFSIGMRLSIRGTYIDISTNLLWNLQTLIISDGLKIKAPIEIWKMAQLRHILVSQDYRLQLPSPPNDKFTLQNLQTLGHVLEFKCSKEVVERIPNIKKLKIGYNFDDDDGGGDGDDDDELDGSFNCYSNLHKKRKDNYLNEYYFLNNLGNLHQLEHLYCRDWGPTWRYWSAKRRYLKQTFTFPCSLKKLHLDGFNLIWEDITTKIGILPNLEKLALLHIRGHEWGPGEGQFPRLRFLELSNCIELETWIVDNTHFPLLEHLVLFSIHKLEIPSSVAEIPTLKSIKLDFCSKLVILSTKEITKEQEELGNSKLLVRVSVSVSETSMSEEELQSLSSDNFEVKICP